MVQTVNALAKKDAHIPFRQCKLTSLLRDALGGNSKTAMIANLWPEERHLEETISTLRFAQRVQALVTDVQQRESGDPALMLRRYERQIRELKQVCITAHHLIEVIYRGDCLCINIQSLTETAGNYGACLPGEVSFGNRWAC